MVVSASTATDRVSTSGRWALRPLEGAIAIAPRLIDPAQVVAGQGHQEPVEGRRVGPRRGPAQDGGGRCPVAEQPVGRPESRQAASSRVGADPQQGRLMNAGTGGP